MNEPHPGNACDRSAVRESPQREHVPLGDSHPHHPHHVFGMTELTHAERTSAVRDNIDLVVDGLVYTRLDVPRQKHEVLSLLSVEIRTSS